MPMIDSAKNRHAEQLRDIVFFPLREELETEKRSPKESRRDSRSNWNASSLSRPDYTAISSGILGERLPAIEKLDVPALESPFQDSPAAS